MVAMQRHTACDKCGRCGGILGGPDRKDEKVEVANPIKAAEGQMVSIEVDDRQILKVAFFLYMMPVLALLAGIIGVYALSDALNYGGDEILLAVGVGFACMAIAVLGLRAWDRTAKNDSRYIPVIKSLAEVDDMEDGNNCEGIGQDN